MRLLLDANLSPKRIGSALVRRGHDVLSLASDAKLGTLDDPQVLELAAEEGRILITRNGRDLAPLLREWATSDRHRSGCILIWTLGHHQFGPIIQGVVQLLRDHPDEESWRDRTVAL